MGKTKITLRELQSLVDTLNFCSKAIPAVRAFNRRFCNAMCIMRHSSHFHRVDMGMKNDLKVWLDFIQHFYGTLNFQSLNWYSNEQVNLYTDSAGNAKLGCVL